MITRDRLVQTFLDLVAIDSPSGEEEAIAAELVARLQALGADAAPDDHGNVIGHLDGEGEPLMLNAHMDTVEPGRGITPVFDGDDIIRSDGTTILGADDKAGIACILEVLQSLRDDGASHRPLDIVFTRGEEIGLVGARHLDYDRVRAKVAIVVDSGGPPSVIQGKAPYHYTYEVEVHGRAAHAGVEPEKGVPAIHIGAEVILGLPQGRLDHETTANVGRAHGGQVVNAVPDYFLIEGEMRSMEFEKVDALVDRSRAHLDDIRGRHPEAKIEASFELGYPGYELRDDDPAAQLLFGVLRGMGMEPNPIPVGGGTDGNVFRGQGIASIVIGRGGYNQHTKEEYLVIPEMLECARVLEQAVRAGE
jgi:tripeptide aminopeptidase